MIEQKVTPKAIIERRRAKTPNNDNYQDLVNQKLTKSGYLVAKRYYKKEKMVTKSLIEIDEGKYPGFDKK